MRWEKRGRGGVRRGCEKLFPIDLLQKDSSFQCKKKLSHTTMHLCTR